MLVHLTLAEKVNEKVKVKLIHEFKTPESFEDFSGEIAGEGALKQKLGLRKKWPLRLRLLWLSLKLGDGVEAKKKTVADNARAN